VKIPSLKRKEWAARATVARALRDGRLVRPKRCQECHKPSPDSSNGRSTIQAHHHKGYDLPLDVQWLCVKCHRPKDPCARGEAQGSCKLTSREVTAIRKRYRPSLMGPNQGSQPNSLPSLSFEFGVHVSTIHRIVTRVTWRHLK
jgi:hypothetical protein